MRGGGGVIGDPLSAAICAGRAKSVAVGNDFLGPCEKPTSMCALDDVETCRHSRRSLHFRLKAQLLHEEDFHSISVRLSPFQWKRK